MKIMTQKALIYSFTGILVATPIISTSMYLGLNNAQNNNVKSKATIYIEEDTQNVVTTFAKDLSDRNVKKVMQIGFYEDSEEGIKAVRMPRTIEEVPNELPSEIESLREMFRECSTFNQDLSRWNTSNVKNMRAMFYNTKTFNQDLSNWNTSNVYNMKGMFYDAIIFNGNIKSWITTKVTDMSFMFYFAKGFNQDISNWNTQNVTDMSNMFGHATKFNQDISKWNVGKVSEYKGFAYNAGFANDKCKWPAKFRTEQNYFL